MADRTASPSDPLSRYSAKRNFARTPEPRGYGVPFIKALSRGKEGTGLILRAVVWHGLKLAKQAYRELFTNSIKRGEFFRSEEEHVANMMCVVGIGRDSAVGQFRLGKGLLDTPLRVRRTDGKAFWDDPIFHAIRTTLARLADKLRAPGTTDPFDNPFLTPVAAAFSAESISVPHPSGAAAWPGTPKRGG
jgi:hypothetical protein